MSPTNYDRQPETLPSAATSTELPVGDTTSARQREITYQQLLLDARDSRPLPAWLEWPLRLIHRLIFGPTPDRGVRARPWHPLVAAVFIVTFLSAANWYDGGWPAVRDNLPGNLAISALFFAFALILTAHRYFLGTARKWCVCIQLIIGQLMAWGVFLYLTNPPAIPIAQSSSYFIYLNDTEAFYPVDRQFFDEWSGKKWARSRPEQLPPISEGRRPPIATTPPPSSVEQLASAFRSLSNSGTSATPFAFLLLFAYCIPLWLAYFQITLLLYELFDTTKLFQGLLILLVAATATYLLLPWIAPELASAGATTAATVVIGLGYFFLGVLFYGVKDTTFLSRFWRFSKAFWSIAQVACFSAIALYFYRSFPKFQSTVDDYWYALPAVGILLIGHVVLIFIESVAKRGETVVRIHSVRRWTIRSVVALTFLWIAGTRALSTGVRDALIPFLIAIAVIFAAFKEPALDAFRRFIERLKK